MAWGLVDDRRRPMSRGRGLLAVAALMVLGGCDGCGDSGPRSPESLVPERASVVLSLRPLSALPRARHGFEALFREVGGRRLLETALAERTASLGFDPWSAAGLSAAGFDVTRGMALGFVRSSGLLVLPVRAPDRVQETLAAALRPHLGGAESAPETLDGHAVRVFRSAKGGALAYAAARAGHVLLSFGPAARGLVKEALELSVKQSFVSRSGYEAVRAQLGSGDGLYSIAYPSDHLRGRGDGTARGAPKVTALLGRVEATGGAISMEGDALVLRTHMRLDLAGRTVLRTMWRAGDGPSFDGLQRLRPILYLEKRGSLGPAVGALIDFLATTGRIGSSQVDRLRALQARYGAGDDALAIGLRPPRRPGAAGGPWIAFDAEEEEVFGPLARVDGRRLPPADPPEGRASERYEVPEAAIRDFSPAARAALAAGRVAVRDGRARLVSSASLLDEVGTATAAAAEPAKGPGLFAEFRLPTLRRFLLDAAMDDGSALGGRLSRGFGEVLARFGVVRLSFRPEAGGVGGRLEVPLRPSYPP